MRCYNGAWDDEALALFAEQDRIMAEINKLYPRARCTYFPAPGFFVVFDHDTLRDIGPECESKLDALKSCLRLIKPEASKK